MTRLWLSRGVHAKLDQGYTSARLASIDAMNELGGAIVSITLVMMAVFVPVSFMGGTAGTFYRQFGMTMANGVAIDALCPVLLKRFTEVRNIPPEGHCAAYKSS